MSNLKDETWEADMLAAVDANHRRAVMQVNKRREPEKPEMPCLLWVAAMAAIAAACLVYAAW